jgi:spore coat polysaccharide biosynthesis protein SpsF (cytidylyltransferase family)
MIGVFITARLGSKRLQEKHLIEVDGKTLIQYLVRRFSIAFEEKIRKNELKLFLTTSIQRENRKFEKFFDTNEVTIFYGSDDNIPLRHLECALQYDIDYIISIDGDDILCSTEATKLVIDSLLNGSKMVQVEGLPLGMNPTGYTVKFLDNSLKGKEPNKLETGWGKIFDKNEIEIIKVKVPYDYTEIRMTLDYEADANFFKTVISNIDVVNVTDTVLIDSIRKNNWSQFNIHLDDIYWSNFNAQKQQEN